LSKIEEENIQKNQQKFMNSGQWQFFCPVICPNSNICAVSTIGSSHASASFKRGTIFIDWSSWNWSTTKKVRQNQQKKIKCCKFQTRVAAKTRLHWTLKITFFYVDISTHPANQNKWVNRIYIRSRCQYMHVSIITMIHS